MFFVRKRSTAVADEQQQENEPAKTEQQQQPEVSAAAYEEFLAQDEQQEEEEDGDVVSVEEEKKAEHPLRVVVVAEAKQSDTEINEGSVSTTTRIHTSKDDNSNNEPAGADGEEALIQAIVDPETARLNEAFTALENMRLANLEMELQCHKIDPKHCVTCLRRDAERRKAGQRGSWGWNKRNAFPCLVCASPTCPRHTARLSQQQQQQSTGEQSHLTVCRHCAPLFGLDFIVDLIHNGDDDPVYRRKKVDQLVDSYDRAVIVLRYLRQFIDETADALEQTARRDNKIGLGSSATGFISGVTGVAAAAIHFAAMSTLAVGAAATVLTPVGPPLLLASIALGGTAAAASSGSEAVSYYSEPNQLANRIVALHELVASLLKVTVALRDALTRGHINLKMYCLENGGSDDDDESEGEQLDTSSTTNRQMIFEDLSSRSSSFRGEDDSLSNAEVAGVESDPAPMATTAVKLELTMSDTDGDAEEPNAPKIDTLMGNVVVGENASQVTCQDNNLNASTSPRGTETNETMIDSQIVPQKSPKNKNNTCSSNNIRQAVTRTATNTLKAAQVASAACGVLSVASIVLEAKNMTDAVQRMKAGNRHPKADILRAIKEEIDRLPDTSLIAAQCESYLKHEAAQDEEKHEQQAEQEEEEEPRLETIIL